MRHKLLKTRLGRCSSHRSSLLANLTVSLVQHEQIQVTLHMAKALRCFVEPLITKSKNNPDSLSVRRKLISLLPDDSAVQKLIDVISKQYIKRNGGYTRIIRSGFRKGDNAPMAYIELVDRNIDAKGVSFTEQAIVKEQNNTKRKG